MKEIKNCHLIKNFIYLHMNNSFFIVMSVKIFMININKNTNLKNITIRNLILLPKQKTQIKNP
jgi:hypothetical protein